MGDHLEGLWDYLGPKEFGGSKRRIGMEECLAYDPDPMRYRD